MRTAIDAIADDWYRAIAPMASVLLDAPVRQRVNDLTERIIALVLTKPPDLDAAHCIGVALARSLYCCPLSIHLFDDTVI